MSKLFTNQHQEFPKPQCQEKPSFRSLSVDLTLANPPLARNQQYATILGEPLYVSFPYVEKWAASEGFYHVEKGLEQQGLAFWKNGAYFSKAQLLIYINQKRLERKLQPLSFYEEDAEL